MCTLWRDSIRYSRQSFNRLNASKEKQNVHHVELEEMEEKEEYVSNLPNINFLSLLPSLECRIYLALREVSVDVTKSTHNEGDVKFCDKFPFDFVFLLKMLIQNQS